MQETTYDDGNKVIRLGPLAEMQRAAMNDLQKEHVVGVRLTKIPWDLVEEAIYDMESKVMATNGRDGSGTR